MLLTLRGARVRAALYGILGLAVIMAAGSCNTPELMPFTSVVRVQRSDHILNPPKSKFDLLWVIDDSHSMCPHQDNLVSNLETFLFGSGTGGARRPGIVDLEGDFNMGVVTTDASGNQCMMPDGAPASPLNCANYDNCKCSSDLDCDGGAVCSPIAGRLRRAPARSDHVACSRPCEADGDCDGECLCGIPHLQRCDDDSDCFPGQRCLGHSNVIRHCANPCEEQQNCGLLGWDFNDQGDRVPVSNLLRQRTLECVDTVDDDDQDGRHCLLRRCRTDGDCLANSKCMEAQDGNRYCRVYQFTTETLSCPPPTCDCPKEFSHSLNIMDYDLFSDDDFSRGRAVEDLNRDFRCMATVGTHGSRFEKGLETMEKALSTRMNSSSDSPNHGFLRDGSYLGILFLTDEDDCSDAVGSCSRDSDCPGFSNDEQQVCVRDPVDGNRYCRINEGSPEFPRSASMCYWAREKLRPAEDYIKFMREIRDEPTREERDRGLECRSDSDCNQAGGEYCSDRYRVCAKSRVIVAGILAPKENSCVPNVESCQAVERVTCEEDPYCSISCGDNEVCVEPRFIRPYGPLPSCTATIGPNSIAGFNSARYHALLDSFPWSVSDSICDEQFTGALQRIAEVIEQVDKPVYALNHPLLTCLDDDDCQVEGGSCLQHNPPEQPLGAYCGDRNGKPVSITIKFLPLDDEGRPMREQATTVARDRWTFRPWLPYGAIEFRGGSGPHPGEVVEITYRAGIR